MPIASLANIKTSLMSRDPRHKIEKILSLNDLVIEPPHETGLRVTLRSAEDFLGDFIFHDIDDILRDIKIIWRVFHSEMCATADTRTYPIRTCLASKVGIILTATQSPLGPIFQLPCQH